jgi:hypothetical protein
VDESPLIQVMGSMALAEGISSTSELSPVLQEMRLYEFDARIAE